jgi:hypothetical protein
MVYHGLSHYYFYSSNHNNTYIYIHIHMYCMYVHIHIHNDFFPLKLSSYQLHCSFDHVSRTEDEIYSLKSSKQKMQKVLEAPVERRKGSIYAPYCWYMGYVVICLMISYHIWWYSISWDFMICMNEYIFYDIISDDILSPEIFILSLITYW